MTDSNNINSTSLTPTPTQHDRLQQHQHDQINTNTSTTWQTTTTSTPEAGNTLGYVLTAVVPTTPNASAYVDVIAYTSADDIPAEAGQSLNMLELDANGRVVLFKTEVLESADIAS